MRKTASAWEGIAQDIRFGTKLFAKTPGFTAASVLALALGIGASGTIFAFLYSVVLQPLPFKNLSKLVTIWESDPKHGNREVEVSYRNYLDWRKENTAFEDLAVFSSVNLDLPLTGDGEPQQVESTIISHTFFPVLGVQPTMGRVFTPEEDKPGSSSIVISHRLWQSRYGADPKIIGRTIRVDQDVATVVGVMPREFDFPRGVDVWAPLVASFPGIESNRDIRVLRAVGRLRAGFDIHRAQSEMNVIAANINRNRPAQQHGFGVVLTSMMDTVFGKARHALWILMAAVVLVLLTACLNVGNLLLARGTGRRFEIAIRTALGAERSRIVRQLLIESTILASIGAVLGLGFLYAAVAAVKLIAPADLPRLATVAPNAWVVGFTLLLSLMTVLVFGLLPALQNSQPNVAGSLRETASTASTGTSQVRLRNLLVIGEVALAVILATGAGLLVRSFQQLQSLDPGFKSDNVLTFRLTLGPKYQQQQARRQFYGRLLDSLRETPGVESAAAVLLRPLSGVIGWDNPFTLAGQTAHEQASNANANYEAISPDYFRTMGIPLLAGRDFTRADTERTQGVIIVNESLARKFWGVEEAVGQRIKLGRPDGPQPWLTVVGVAKDVRYREWESTRTDLYIPFTQRAQHRSDFVIKTSMPPENLVAAVRKAVYAIDKDQAISNVTTMEELVGAALARPRFNAFLLSVFAICALLLSALGVYGLISYVVAQQTTEIGIRMALGCRVADLMYLVIRRGLVLVAIGIAAGTAGSLMLAHLLGSVLFGIQPYDATTYLAVALILVTCGGLASLMPAVRAARIDPAAALRQVA